MLEKKHWWFEHQFLLDLHSYFGNINMIYINRILYTKVILRRKLTPRSVSKSLVTGSRCLLLFPQFPSKVFVPLEATSSNSVQVLQVKDWLIHVETMEMWFQVVQRIVQLLMFRGWKRCDLLLIDEVPLWAGSMAE